MGWQEDELKKRNDLKLLLDESKKRREIVTKAIIAFWNKLLEANNKVLPEVRAEIKKIGSGCEFLGCDSHGIFLICATDSRPAYIGARPDDTDVTIIYSENSGLLICSPKSQKLKDNDVDTIIRNICTGRRFYDGICN